MKVEVSVICITYNHARYIEQCLDSILSQETTFGFEIIVHDDASTDGTIEIINEYARKYPEKVVPIIEEENCHSRGIIFLDKIKKHIQGKYVALCECDDWWTDNQKLQRQWEYMEDHPECSLYVHAVRKYMDAEGRFVGEVAPSHTERDYTTDDVIIGDGGMFGTNSMFLRSKYYPRPSEYLRWGVGDYPDAIYLSTVGVVHYDPRVMSSYRIGSVGSWTERMSNPDYAASCRKRLVDSLRRWDVFTDGKYHQAVEKRIALWVLDDVSLKGDWSEVRRGEAREAYRSVDVMTRLKYRVKTKHPELFTAVQKLKNHER